jgi:sugar phosphate isomerase/epimerase
MWSIGFPGAEAERPMGWRELFDKARESGVRVVQFGPNLPLEALQDLELDALARQAREWNLEIEAGTRGIEPEILRRSVDVARRCGATLLRSIPEIGGGEIPSPEIFAAHIRCILPELEKAGIRLALENGRIPAAQLSEMIDSIGSPLVGVTLDTVNSLAIPEGTEHVARTLARHTLCLHLKDFVVFREWHMMGFRVEGRPAGQGQLDVPWLLGLLREAGRSPNAILELWPPEQATREETIALEQRWAAESIAWLRRCISD